MDDRGQPGPQMRSQGRPGAAVEIRRGLSHRSARHITVIVQRHFPCAPLPFEAVRARTFPAAAQVKGSSLGRAGLAQRLPVQQHGRAERVELCQAGGHGVDPDVLMPQHQHGADGFASQPHGEYVGLFSEDVQDAQHEAARVHRGAQPPHVRRVYPVQLLALVPLVLFTLFKFPRAKQAQGFPIRQAARVARDPLLWLCGFLLFFQSGNEFTAGGWISTYLQKTFGVGPSEAALTLAGYWAAVMAGRLASARFAKALRGKRLVLSSGVLALAAAVLLVVSPSGALAMAGAVLLGLGFSAIYPTTLAIVGENFASFTGTAFSFVISVGLAGGMISPWLVGRIAQASSLRHGLFVPVFDCAMILVLLAMIMKTLEARREAGLKKQP